MSKGISDDDRELFRRSMGDSKPIKMDKIQHSKPKPPITIRSDYQEYENDKRPSDRPADISFEDSLFFARDGVQTKQLKKLRQGKFPCQAECDLHGLNRKEAQKILEKFIYECLEHGNRYVRVVHGKGYRSENKQPILKNYINHVLREFTDILAFCSAQPKDGGLGAVYVLLRH